MYGSHVRASFSVLILAFAGAGCTDGLFVSPAAQRDAGLQVAFTLAGAADPGAAFDAADRIRVRVPDVGVDTTLAFQPAAETRVRVRVPAAPDEAARTVEIDLMRGSDVLFSGTTTAQLDGGTATATVALSPVPGTITVADSLPVFTALGDTGTVVPSVHFATGEPMTGVPLTWTSSNTAVATVDQSGQVRAVGRGVAQVQAAHASGVTATSKVIVCLVQPLANGSTTEQFDANDCTYYSGERADHYEFAPPADQLTVIERTGLTGPFGIKDITADPRAFNILYATSNAASSQTIRIVGNGEPIQMFVHAPDSAASGGYTLTRRTQAAGHTCDSWTFMMPGSALSSSHNGTNSCHTTISFDPTGTSLGQPLHTHLYPVKLRAGETYTATLHYSGSGFEPAFVVWRGSEPLVHSLPFSGPSPRIIQFTTEAGVYHTIEVSSGYWADAERTQWVQPSGSYSLSISR